MEEFNVNPEDLLYNSAYPSPPDTTVGSQTKKRKSVSSDDSPQPEHPAKKKRKAWGQPVPEIVKILPPRKRAKTAEEKEQRRNERILRNRRAADKSRQRQKAAVADLERRTVEIEQENNTLKAMLERYRSKFGDLEGFSFDNLLSPSHPVKSEEQSVHTPASVHTDFSHSTLVSTPAMAPNSPVLVADSKPLPPLTHTLFPPDSDVHDFGMDYLTATGVEPSISGVTQYPAAVLCSDLQCPPDTLASPTSRHFHQFIQFLAKINFHWMIYGPFWTSTLTPLYQLYQILVGSLPSSSTVPIISQILDNHFPLIIGLIFPPLLTTPSRTSPTGVFRMKLLSRLLTCSPKMARLLLAATDRELRAVVGDEGFADDTTGLKGQWAKLMTLKWMIVRLEVEHGRYRRGLKQPQSGDILGRRVEGVDYVGLERSLGRWRREGSLDDDDEGRQRLTDLDDGSAHNVTATTKMSSSPSSPLRVY